MLRLTLLILCACWIVSSGETRAAKEQPFGIEKRIALKTSRVIGSPDPLTPFRAKRIFPNLTFKNPLFVVQEPGTQRIFVVELAGKIHEFPHDQTVKKTDIFLDLNRTIYSFCFHPNYKQNGYIYTFCNVEVEGGKHNQISRFTVSRKTPLRADLKSELLILQYPSAGHNGHYVEFGHDGMLYISAGDGSVGMDPKLDGQDISNLRGTIIRIDVDHPTAARPYSIPKDNPFISHPNARPEIWAFGFRNPYRFAFDPANGQLWVADIGQDVWEMIYLVERGGNYGWSIMEGPEGLNLNRPRGPTLISPPIISHPHSEMRSITGGYFYQGKQFPELQGAYLYGDYDTRRMFGMKYDYQQKKVTWQKELATTEYRIVSIGADNAGEPLIVSYTGELLTLERRPKEVEPKVPFPRKLSETGLFTSVEKHQLVPAAIPYSVNSPLWSDGAIKDRYMAIPNTDRVTFATQRAWGFPTHSVLIKTFSVETDPGNSDSTKRIETRLLTLHENGEWLGFCYKWNDDQTDALLVEKAGRDIVYSVKDSQSPGGLREKKWHFPSRAECMVCHTREARYVLGVTTLQMNKSHNYSGTTDNQLRTLEHIGLFTKPLTQPHGDLPKMPNPADKTEPLETRARAYLHANCWHCHVANGGGNARMELHFSKPREKALIFNVKPRHLKFDLKDPRLIVPGDVGRSLIFNRISRRGKHQMPPLASYEVDPLAIDLFNQWILELGEKSPFPAVPPPLPDE